MGPKLGCQRPQWIWVRPGGVVRDHRPRVDESGIPGSGKKELSHMVAKGDWNQPALESERTP